MNLLAKKEVELLDYHPKKSDMKSDVLQGLQNPEKWISSMYFYDEHGSKLFDDICELPEYYPTRTELAIMQENIDDICSALGPQVSLIELGSGSSLKIRELLDHLDDPAVYVPVEISREHLIESAEALQDDYPDLEILPVCADFTGPFDLPSPRTEPLRNIVYFPGSTIGNFEPDDALSLLIQCTKIAKQGGGMLIGVDLQKDRETLERAYNDAAGVTAEFNLNVLTRLNRELQSNFNL
ncbi:MAG: L-histidine N(alpha)-methyltransferase, partial [Gammaproteobacteria bacterium]|nr:L-histidine N(alpha)-methyltransferase [Gammaproteobacteria bacterium]